MRGHFEVDAPAVELGVGLGVDVEFGVDDDVDVDPEVAGLLDDAAAVAEGSPGVVGDVVPGPGERVGDEAPVEPPVVGLGAVLRLLDGFGDFVGVLLEVGDPEPRLLVADELVRDVLPVVGAVAEVPADPGADPRAVRTRDVVGGASWPEPVALEGSPGRTRPTALLGSPVCAGTPSAQPFEVVVVVPVEVLARSSPEVGSAEGTVPLPPARNPCTTFDTTGTPVTAAAIPDTDSVPTTTAAATPRRALLRRLRA